jgi:hypothetical protein
MTYEAYVLRAKLARRMPDPNFGKVEGIEHHLFLVNCRDIPRDLPLEANARRPNTRKQVYRQVRESLLELDGEPGSFHLKNKGIVIVADSVTQKPGTSDQYIIRLDRTRQGILDGGHTYQIITEAQDSEELPEDQFVFIQIRTAIPKDWIPDISQGLNTAVQVQDMSLQHLAGKFAWLKSEMSGHPYAPKIAWSENDAGEFSARDIISLMYLMNIKLFPDSSKHPIAGYEKKSEPLREFDNSDATFRQMKPILHDVLYLHDWISFMAVDFYNEGAGRNGVKGRGAGLSFVKQAGRKPYSPTFMSSPKGFDAKLEDAALYPIMAAFRVFIEVDLTTGKVRWAGGFEGVKAAWRDLAYELMKATMHTANEVGRSRNAIGKSRLHWDGVFQKVENYKLRKLAAAA